MSTVCSEGIARLPRSLVVPAVLIVPVVLGGLATGCKVKDPPPVTETWTDEFERDRIGSDYYKTGGGYEIVDGALKTSGSYNHPLWLRKTLPRDVRVEFDCWSNSPDGDIKVEIFGDGMSHARNKGSYNATGYVLIMGGWSNTKSIIARGDEHARNMPERKDVKVELGKRYRWIIERRDKKLTWWIHDAGDDEANDQAREGPGDRAKPFLERIDPAPFHGSGHQYFGFNNWESDSYFDNLRITPL